MPALTDDQKRIIANGDFNKALKEIPPTQPETSDHDQNTDQYVDLGGPNETTAAQIKAAVAGGASGYSGYSGFSGAGTSGYSGYSGIDGASGYSGYSGVDGISGYSGYSGVDGAAGATGTSGYSGASGFSGADNALPVPPVGDGTYHLNVTSGVATWVSV